VRSLLLVYLSLQEVALMLILQVYQGSFCCYYYHLVPVSWVSRRSMMTEQTEQTER